MVEKNETTAKTLPYQHTFKDKKDSLTEIYVQAIQDYIHHCYVHYQLPFDTLFFGKHVFGQDDDFPDIVLPANIGTTTIRLISPEDGIQKQKQSPSSYYINMMGWVKKKEANFIFVAFSGGMAHQFDVNLQYEYNNKLERYVLK